MSGAERRTRPKSTDEQFSLTAASLVDTSVPIEPASGREEEEEDEFETTDGIDVRSTGSASATSSIYAHTYENGRRYQCFKNGRYPIPNDDSEQDREDMKHAMMLELTDGELFYAPIGDHPQSILDIGTGTGELGLPGLTQYEAQRPNVLNHVIKGIWAIDAGDRYPSARVRGIDLTPIQPTWVPPNVDFLIDDCEKDWLTEDCDLVHLRFMIIILRDVPTVLEHAFKSLRPGGWIELQELCAEPLCDDNTMPDDDPVKYMYDLAGQAFRKFGMDVTLPKRLEPLLHGAGFRNIHVVVKKVPIGVWAKNKTLRLIGLYQKMAILDLMPALAGRPFSALGLSPEESQVTLAFARKGLDDYKTHRYFNYYFWYAQKPVS